MIPHVHVACLSLIWVGDSPQPRHLYAQSQISTQTILNVAQVSLKSLTRPHHRGRAWQLHLQIIGQVVGATKELATPRAQSPHESRPAPVERVMGHVDRAIQRVSAPAPCPFAPGLISEGARAQIPAGARGPPGGKKSCLSKDRSVPYAPTHTTLSGLSMTAERIAKTSTARSAKNARVATAYVSFHLPRGTA